MGVTYLSTCLTSFFREMNLKFGCFNLHFLTAFQQSVYIMNLIVYILYKNSSQVY